VLAAILIAWLLMRGNADDVPPPEPVAPSTSATTGTPSQSPTVSETPQTFNLDEGQYVGRDIDEVLAELRDQGLRPRAREIPNPGDQPADSVAAISPTTGLQEGDRVDVAYYGRPAPTESPTSQSPSQEPTTSSPPTTQPSTESSTPQSAETSTTPAGPTESPAARKDIAR
jgi:serine/threonine-protein kinase